VGQRSTLEPGWNRDCEAPAEAAAGVGGERNGGAKRYGAHKGDCAMKRAAIYTRVSLRPWPSLSAR